MAETVFAGNIIRVETGEVILPGGVRMAMEAVRHPGGAGVVALDEARRVCVLRQYRPVLDAWVWEIPAGKLDDEEAPELAAQRELAEEAGVRAAHWQPLGDMLASPGVFDEVVHLYLATGLTAVATDLGEHEILECHWLDLDAAVARCLSGEFNDAKTVIALLRARARLEATP